jgi:hypothetical protein
LADLRSLLMPIIIWPDSCVRSECLFWLCYREVITTNKQHGLH